uniref:Uncharacterized protein n=1 Tax=Arundo donax TaxID=35708 RepID=A0A0A9BXB6_ARUDO
MGFMLMMTSASVLAWEYFYADFYSVVSGGKSILVSAIM